MWFPIRQLVRRLLVIGGLSTLLLGCTSLLPHEDERVISPWDSFDEAMSAYEQVVPFESDTTELRDLGFAPDGQVNVHILNQSEVIERLVPTDLIARQDLPRGLRECLDAGERCRAYEVTQRELQRKRYGNFFADFFNFKRKSETRGWRFNALMVLVDDRVVFKQWSGTPSVHEYSDQVNPLGPLQGIGPGAATRVID